MKLSQKAEKAIKTLTDQYLETASAIAMADVVRQFTDGLMSKPIFDGNDDVAMARLLKNGGPREAKPAKAPRARKRRVSIDYAPLVPKLVDLIRKSDGKKVASNVVRKALRLSRFQCRALVAVAVEQRLVRTEGNRKSTVYRLGPKALKKKAA